MDYKHSRIKQYHKEGRALRTETVINDTYDFDVGRRLKNLDDLKQIGFAANRRLLGVERLSHDATIGAETLAALHRPALVDGQRASTLRFGDPRVQALLAALLRFDLLPAGFRNREFREAVATLRGMSFDDYNAGQMTYDLRRLRLRGLIERIPRTQRYRLTAEGLCIALAYHRTQARVLGPVLSATRSTDSRPRACKRPSPRTTARSATCGKDTHWPRDQGENRTAGGQGAAFPRPAPSSRPAGVRHQSLTELPPRHFARRLGEPRTLMARKGGILRVKKRSRWSRSEPLATRQRPQGAVLDPPNRPSTSCADGVLRCAAAWPDS